jgi:hypothetical protein
MTVFADASVLDDVLTALRNSPRADQIRFRPYAEDRLVLDVSLHGDRVAFDLLVESGEVHLLLFGRTHSARTLIRSLLANMALQTDPVGEKHRIKCWLHNVGAKQIAGETEKFIISFLREAAWGAVEDRAPALKRDEIPAFWWDGRVNFGDLTGPWIVSALTGRRPVNVRGTLAHSGAVMSVGSVINMLERPGYNIWGSGLLAPLNSGTVRRLRARKPARIAAVRGRLTWHELSTGLGWDLPDVLGDPALLLPRIYQPSANAKCIGEPVFLPHYKHKTLVPPRLAGDMAVIDVEQEPKSVVSAIAAASHVVATSLHGLIVAQAYEVPWTWLQIEGEELAGNQFKFEDFFSTLDADCVSRAALPAREISAQSLNRAAMKATVPATRVNLDRLWCAYPHDALYGRPLHRQQQLRLLTTMVRRQRRKLRAALRCTFN